ncbi:MAG: PAS domain-containing protein [Pirellulaceae bacterium]
MVGRNNHSRMVLSAILGTYGIAEFSLQGNILKANQNFADILGCARDQLIGKLHSVLIRPEPNQQSEPPVSERRFWLALLRGETQFGRFHATTDNGNSVWFSASYCPLKTNLGKVTRILSIVHLNQAIVA